MPPTNSKKGQPTFSSASVENIGRIFQQVHRTAAHTQRCKKEFMEAVQAANEKCVESACAVVLLILKQVDVITPDALKRHYAFLAEVCKAFKESQDSDALSIEMIKCVLPFHNANDKLVRLSVVSTCEILIKAVDQRNASEERQDLYQEVAEVLKQRVHDKCPKVRERAVAGVAAFQTGKKGCDVTQQLIALLCTDGNADVRRQVLRCIAPRKEFLEGYFHGMIRCTRDTVARVRAEAWDALSRFPWRYITAYASAKNIKLPELIMQGLTDANASAVIACKAAVTNCWLHRDCKDECSDFLDPISCGYVFTSLAPLELISQELLTYCLKRHSFSHFHLDLENIHTSAILMWRASCRYACDTEGADDTLVLMPLEQFSGLLQDTVYAYARPDVPPKTVKFRSVEDADNMLRILLSVFELYEENGYLAHVDNTTRTTLLRLLNFLLKVVPDDDPALFVDIAVRSLKSLTVRTPEEATKTVTSALDSLFRSLKLPQNYALGYDDVEALGRKSRERQQELVRLQAQVLSGGASQESLDQLRDEMERDEKFMLRMQLIVLAFLSHSGRGDEIPSFCSHVIQLGRQQDNEKVKAAATKSLGLQCLISPDSVHTFMPLILADTHDIVTAERSGVPLAAIGVVFDLVMEYGLRFFDAPGANHVGASAYPSNSELEARLRHEQDLAEEDAHKVGSRSLLETLLSYLAPSESEKNTICIVGFCKLLSCNRISNEVVALVIAKLLLHYMHAQTYKKDSATSAYIADFLDVFFRSYASSHPKRQEFFSIAGMSAFRVLLASNTAWAAKLAGYVTSTSDAFILSHIRDIDPEVSKRVSKETHAGNEEGASSDDANTLGHNSSVRSNAARSSMQSGRLLRELSRHSLHESLATDLLLEVISEESNADARLVCVDVLEKKLYSYSKDPQPFLQYCANKASALFGGDEALGERLSIFAEEVSQRFPPATDAPTTEALDAMLADRVAERDRMHTELLERGYQALVPQQQKVTVHPSGKVKSEHVERKRERDNDAFDVEAIVGARRRR